MGPGRGMLAMGSRQMMSAMRASKSFPAMGPESLGQSMWRRRQREEKEMQNIALINDSIYIYIYIYILNAFTEIPYFNGFEVVNFVSEICRTNPYRNNRLQDICPGQQEI